MKIDKERRENIFYGLLIFFGLTVLSALFWSAWWFFTGEMPRGLLGLSRWWDILIYPSWVAVMFLAGRFYFAYEQPIWVTRWGILFGFLGWLLAGLAAFLYGFASLVPVLVVLFFVYFGLQIRVSVRRRAGYNVLP